MATEPTEPTGGSTLPRQTLAMRLAERERQRSERAERLARLRPAPGAEPAGTDLAPDFAPDISATPVATLVAGTDPGDDAAAALDEFLRALTGGAPVAPRPAAEPAAVLHFQRPEAPMPAATDETDLDRLPGAGPGLVGALRRAGLDRLADIAPLAPEALAARLGPIGRLVPAEAWIATARDAAPPGPHP